MRLARMTPRRGVQPALYLCLLVAAILNAVVLMSMSQTLDEPAHLDYGRRVLQRQPDRAGIFDDSKMPVSALNAVPQAIAQALDDRHLQPRLAARLRDVRWARVPTVLATLALVMMAFRWARDLYGETAAVAAGLLTAVSPNLLAHGTLATTDMYFALGVVGSLYYLRRYLIDPTLKHAIVSAAALAAAQLTKPFAVYLYGVAGAFVVLLSLTRSQPGRRPRDVWRLNAIHAGLAIVFFVAVLNVAFSFDRSFTPLGRYVFQTDAFRRLQQLPILSSLPVPVPYPWLTGLDMMRMNEQTGQSFANIYLLGQVRRALDPTVSGFKSYYLVAFFYKVPIGLQLLMALGLWNIWESRHRREALAGEAPLIVAAAIPFVWLSLFSRAQIGIRHILPCLAIGIILASAAFASLGALSRRRRGVLYALSLWVAISVASYFPHMIPYMNEWVTDRRMAYKVLADSNLDWGQSDAIIHRFLEDNPDVIFEPEEPVAGRILVSANTLVGVAPRETPNRLLWLRSRYLPTAHVGYTHLLFVVPPGDQIRPARLP